MNIIRKWLAVPRSNDVVQVWAAQLWEVRWNSRYNEYAHGLKPEVEAFPNEADAHAFADALTNAFRLIRHTSGNAVSVVKARSDARD